MSDAVDTKALEEEGEFAADYLEELMDIIDLDGDIEIDVANNRALVEIVAAEGNDKQLRRLVGNRGETLDALQELTRLAVLSRSGNRSRLLLDIAGFRADRRNQLVELAKDAVTRIRDGEGSVALSPMNSYERKIVHDAVAEAGLTSSSAGVEPGRHVVVSAS